MSERCVLVRGGDAVEGSTGVTYAPGVSMRTTGSTGLCLELATLPAGARGRAHQHVGHESAAYVLEGEFVLWFGEQLAERIVAQAGDFIYIPARVPHLPANGSASAPAVAVLARTDPDEQESAVSRPDLDGLPHIETAAR
jgi:uncharacterized RmlC-like cupin family protein